MTALEAALVALAGAMVAANWAERNQWAPPAIAKALRWLWIHLPGRQRNRMLTQLIGDSVKVQATIARIETRLNGTNRTMQVLLKMQRLQEESMGMATLLTDETGLCVWANQHYLNLVGLPLDDVLNSGWKNVIPQELQPEVIGAWQHSVQDQRDFRMRYAVVHVPTGNQIPVHGTAHIVLDEDTQEVIGWVAHVRPLTDRHAEAHCEPPAPPPHPASAPGDEAGV